MRSYPSSDNSLKCHGTVVYLLGKTSFGKVYIGVAGSVWFNLSIGEVLETQGSYGIEYERMLGFGLNT